MPKKLNRYKMLLQIEDESSLNSRAERLSEISAEFKPVIHHRIEGPPSRERDYRREAENSYVNGNFRSCIFLSAVIIDQVFRHEYVKLSEDKEKSLKEVKSGPFGKAIGLIEKLLKDGKASHIKPFVEKAKKLKRIRNCIAVHPAYVDLPLSESFDLVKEINREDIISLINLLVETDPQIKTEERELVKEEILKTAKFSGLGQYGGRKPWYTLKKVLEDFEDPLWLPGDVRKSIEDSILKPLALRSYRLMNEIVGGIYGIQKDIGRPLRRKS